MADRYWNSESQQWEYRSGGGAAPGPGSAIPPPGWGSRGGDGGGHPFRANPYGEDFGGRATGIRGVPALEGQDQSNLIDPTPFLEGQTGRYNPETGTYEGGYQGEYRDLFNREDPVAIALGNELLARGQAVAGGAQDYAGLISGEAGRVSGLAPGAVATGARTAADMRREAELLSEYGPAAVEAARSSAADMRGQARDLRGFTDPAATALGDYGGNQLALYGSSFRPIEQQIAEFARGYDTPERRAREAERARASVAREFESQRRNAARDLARYGIDPSMGRGQAIRERTAQATAQAAADEASRRAVEERAIALRERAAGLGGNIAARGTGATATGAQLGAQGAQGAAGIQQGAGGLEQQGIRTGADVGATGANIYRGAGDAALSGIQTGGNLGQQSGQLLTGAANIARTGAESGSNIQLGGQGARQGAIPMLNQAQSANLQGANMMQNWNTGIWNTQANRASQPSGLLGAAGTAIGLAAPMIASRFIPPSASTNPTTGQTGGADGGFLYSTRQRFADGGIMPAGTPASAWLMNRPAMPVTGRTYSEGGEVVLDPRCQRFGKDFRMPDGSPCELRDARDLAEGGSAGALPILGTVAGGILGAAFGGPSGAVMGAKLGNTAGSAISQAGSRPAGAQTSRAPAASPTPPLLAAVPLSSPDRPIPVTEAASGGRVFGPSDGTGIDDQVPANLSAGEYVIPADVVAKLGTMHFDKLLEKHHTPADVQRAIA